VPRLRLGDGQTGKTLALTVRGSPADMPVILEGTRLHLPHTVALSPELLATELDLLDGGVEQRSGPTVLYWNANKPLAKVRWFNTRPPKVTNMSARHLLRELSASAAAEAWERVLPQVDGPSARCDARDWFYYSAPNQTRAVQLARSHLDVAALEEAVLATGKDLKVHSVNMWLGGAGVVSSAHYDASANVFAQIHGRKRFLLSSPLAADALEPFSFLHPHFRRTQMTEEGALERGADPSWFAQAILDPGDVLVLPPFVFHHVTAISTVSLSVNAWASGGAVERVQGLQRAPAAHFGLVEPSSGTQGSSGRLGSPGVFDSGWTLQLRAALLERVAQQLAARALDESAEGARSWLNTAMRSRWASVIHRFPRPMRKLARFCVGGMRDGREEMLEAHLRRKPLEASEAVTMTVERSVSSAAAALRELPAGATELETGNLVEALAMEVLGDAKTAGSFLVLCFSTVSGQVLKDHDTRSTA
jgi:hypothetical protein